jgi:phage/plasmid-like protein (TIGR03299 family)
MSHDLNHHNGRDSFVGVIEPAWHGLGTILPERFNTKEALEYANLDFKVAKGKALLQYNKEDREEFGKRIPLKNSFFTYRTDNGECLCNNGISLTKRYEIVQNIRAFEFFDEIIGQELAIYETAGCLGSGETVFITAKLPDSIMPQGDKIDQYLLFRLSHNGSSAIQIAFTPIRVVCANTLSYALDNTSSVFKINHTKSAHERLDIASSIIASAKDINEDLYETASRMIDYRITDHNLRELLCRTFLTGEDFQIAKDSSWEYWLNKELASRRINLITTIHEYCKSGVGQNDVTKDNLWGFVNGITSYFQNQASYSSDERKMISILDGHASTVSKTAFQLANNLLIKQGLNKQYE